MRLEELQHGLIFAVGLLFRFPEGSRNTITPYSLTYHAPKYHQKEASQKLQERKISIPSRRIPDFRYGRSYTDRHTLPSNKWLRSRGY